MFTESIDQGRLFSFEVRYRFSVMPGIQAFPVRLFPEGSMELSLVGLFGSDNAAGLTEGNETTADMLWVHRQGHQWDQYYYSDGVNPEVSRGWRQVGQGNEDLRAVTWPIERALLFQRRGQSDLEIELNGAPRVDGFQHEVSYGTHYYSKVIESIKSLADLGLADGCEVGDQFISLTASGEESQRFTLMDDGRWRSAQGTLFESESIAAPDLYGFERVELPVVELTVHPEAACHHPHTGSQCVCADLVFRSGERNAFSECVVWA